MKYLVIKSESNDDIHAPMNVHMVISQNMIMNNQNERHLPQLMIGISYGVYVESGVYRII